MFQLFLEVCCKCFYLNIAYVAVVYTYVSSICFKRFTGFRRMLQQVPHVASVFISRHGKRAQAEAVPTCMRSSMACLGTSAAAGACRVLENLVLVGTVHDNDRLQLPCFGDHVSLETGATRVRACSSNIRNRQDSSKRVQQQQQARVDGGVGSSSMRIRQGRRRCSDDASVRTIRR
jgi:hypothetical protein